MPKIQFSREEILSGTIVAPNWYSAEIVKIEDKKKKENDDGSINTFVSVKILSGEFADVVIYGFLCNSKAFGFAKNFVAAVMGIAPGDLTPEDSFDISEDTCVGKKVDVYVLNDEYNGKPTNKLADWAIFGTQA